MAEIATIPDITRRSADIIITSYYDSNRGVCYKLKQGGEKIEFSMREWALINSVITTDQTLTNQRGDTDE